MTKSLRVAAKVAETSAARLCAAAAEASQPHPADTDVSAGSQHQPATSVAGSRGEAPREDVDPELAVDYSGESDELSDSKPPAPLPGSPRGDTSSSYKTRGSGAFGKRMHNAIFGSSDESYDSVGNRNDDVSAPTDINTRGVGTSIDTTQEALDRNVLRLAPERKPWMLSKHLLDRWSGKTNERFPIPLFDASRLHGLDASAKNFRTENDRYIDAFLEHRWYGPHKRREADAFLQSWNAFITNVSNVGMDTWFQKLIASRNRFEKRSVSGACYRLHRLSREAGLLCLSWGDPCPGCLSTSPRAPKEAYLLTEPWWRARISSEMREGIANLQSLYERAGRSFSDGPPPSDVPCRTARQGRERRPLVGPEVPSYPPTADSHAIGRGNLSDVPSPRGWIISVPQGNASHHGSPPVDEVVEGKSCSLPSELDAELHEYARVTRLYVVILITNGKGVAA